MGSSPSPPLTVSRHRIVGLGELLWDLFPVGAGDAFTAALAHHLVRGHAPARAGAAANR